MKSEDNIWYSIDVETSTQNRYACKVDRVCIAKFDITNGNILSDWEVNCRESISWHTDFIPHDAPIVMHNAGFDLYLIEKLHGYPINNPVHDTMLMAKHYKNDLPSYSLKNLSWMLFGDTYQCLLDLREWLYQNKVPGEDDVDFDMTLPPEKLVHDYCIHDVHQTAKLATFF